MKQIVTRFSLMIAVFFFFSGCEQFAELLTTELVDLKKEGGCTWVTHSKQVDLPGATVQVKVKGWGETPCIVFASSKMYPRVISRELYDDFTFFFVDARWFGEITDSSAMLKFDIQTITKDIDIVRQEMGLEKVAIMGHSIHGTYAMEYARAYPENVSHVVVLGGTPTGLIGVGGAAPAFWEANASSERKEVMASNMQEFTALDVTGMEADDVFILNYVYEAPKYWKNPYYNCAWVWEDVDINTEMIDLVYGLFLTFDPTGIEAPIYAAIGKHDFAIPYTLWEQAESEGSFSNLTVGYYENSGHYPMFEEVERFNEELTAWVDAQ